MRHILEHQKGISFFGILIILAMLGCFFLFGLRAFPIYTEYFSMKSAMQSVANQPFSERNSPTKVRSLLLKNLDINSVYRFNEGNIKEITKVKKKNSKRYLFVKYDASERLFGNLHLTLKVDESIELSGGK